MVGISLFLLAVACNVVLAIFVLGNNPRAKLNRVFGGLALTVAAWCVVTYLEDSLTGESIIQALVVADFLLASLMVFLFFWFCYVLTRSQHKVFGTLNAVGLLIASSLALTGSIVTIALVDGAVIFMPSFGYNFFLIYIAYGLLGGLIMLARRYRGVRSTERNQIAFIFYGLFLCASTIVVTNVALPYFFVVPASITRIGIYSTLFLTGAMAYVIIKHRFLSIRWVVARSVTYVLLITTLAAGYSLALFTVSQYLFPENQSSLEQNLTYAALAVLLAITFQPLKAFFERVTDRFLFRDHYDSQEVLNDFGRVLVGELKLERLMDQSLKLLGQRLKVAHAHLYVFDDGKIYRVSHYGSIPARLPTVARLQLLRHRLAVADELERGKEKEILETFDIRLSLHVRTKGEFVGYLLLGDKLNGDIYIEQDIELLEILGQELAVAISNAKAYDEIAHFNTTLQQRVDEATQQLRAANARLKDLDAAKDEFISMASHQLRTPLTSIKGYLSMIMEGDAGKITKQQKEFIGYAFESSRQMSSLVADMLNVSRMSAGKFFIEKAPVDLLPIVKEEVEQLRGHAEEKGLKLAFETPKGAIPTLQLDESKTRQVVMNFIDNAIFYTKTGSITVTLERIKDRVELRVTDTGIGVPMAARPKLFSKFYRAQNAQTVRPDGTGLGLFLAKRVVEDQGGTIVFESTEGQGSTFGFTFPVSPSKSK